MGTISYGFTDTAISGVSTLELSRGLLNFGADWREIGKSQSNEVMLTNITSPLDRSEKMRIGVTPIANIYQNSGILDAVKAPSSKGVSILCQLTNTLRSVGATTSVDLPVSAHLVLKVPAHEDITAEVLLTLIGRLLSGLFETGSDESTRLKAIMRGSLLPADL